MFIACTYYQILHNSSKLLSLHWLYDCSSCHQFSLTSLISPLPSISHTISASFLPHHDVCDSFIVDHTYMTATHTSQIQSCKIKGSYRYIIMAVHETETSSQSSHFLFIILFLSAPQTYILLFLHYASKYVLYLHLSPVSSLLFYRREIIFTQTWMTAFTVNLQFCLLLLYTKLYNSHPCLYPIQSLVEM